jgi:peptidyl-prolyl cis-trans isomerase D
MLDLIRKKQKTILVKFVFWAIIATFIGSLFFLYGDEGERSSDVAVRVNKAKIGFDEYQAAYGNLYRLYQEVYREQFTPELERQLRLREQALDALIEQTLLLQEANRLGIKVSQRELVDAISRIPAFHENGVFSKERYVQVLAAQRLFPEDFEEMQRRNLLIDKVQERLHDGITVTEAEIEEEYRHRNDMVQLAFLRFDPTLFEKDVTIDEEGLQAFFEENSELFRVPEAVSLQYVKFDPASYKKDVTLSDEDLQRFYRRHLDRYDIPDQVRASHILVRIPDEATTETREEKRAAAEKILADARGGKDFAQLARTHSEDIGSAARGGDLGFFPRGSMVPSFEATAFALAPGQISGLVETNYGYHIIRVEERIQARVKPLEEVKEEVEAGLLAERARQLAFEKAMDAYNMNRRTGDMTAAAKGQALEIQETDFFTRQEPVAGFANSLEVTAIAFNLSPGEMARPVQMPEGVFLFALKEQRESRIPDLAEVRANVEQAYRREKGQELARQHAEKALAELQEGRTLAAVSRQAKGKVEETASFSRAQGIFIPRLGSSDRLARSAFDLTAENPAAPGVFEIDGQYVIAALKNRQDADPAGLDQARRQELEEILLARKKEEVLDAKLRELRDHADIQIAISIQNSLEG